MISSIYLLRMNVVMPDPKTVFWIAAFVAGTAASF